jgi:hypothetical protein
MPHLCCIGSLEEVKQGFFYIDYLGNAPWKGKVSASFLLENVYFISTVFVYIL